MLPAAAILYEAYSTIWGEAMMGHMTMRRQGCDMLVKRGFKSVCRRFD